MSTAREIPSTQQEISVDVGAAQVTAAAISVQRVTELTLLSDCDSRSVPANCTLRSGSHPPRRPSHRTGST